METAIQTETHIGGVIVHCRPSHAVALKSRLARFPGTQVHAATPEGKLVATVEAGSAERILDVMDAMRRLPGVLNVALVYQHAEPTADLEQEIEP